MRHYAATIGFFDGVHRGHRYLIGQLLAEAARRDLDAALITFETHPRQDIRLLSTFKERTSLLQETGVTEIFCFQYPLIQNFTAREFMQILHERCAVDTLLVGYDHRFGSDLNEAGRTIQDYIREGKEVGVELVLIEQSPEGNMSSSKIRKALEEGRIADANAMLGYEYMLSGVVAHGRHIGHTLGFPTANLVVDENKLIPAHGVYACMVHEQAAIVNIGTNPTVGTNPETIEVHIPGCNEDLYDQKLTIRLTRRIRDEKTFATLDELRRQIERDLKEII